MTMTRTINRVKLRDTHRRTGQHPFGGGQTEFCPNGFSGGGVVAEIFRDPYSVGGGGSSRHFPGSVFCGVTELFPVTAVTDPKFVFFPLNAVTYPKFVFSKHVLCFARIMSTLCPNSCRQTARIGGGQLPPCPPSRTPMGTLVFLGSS